MRLDLAFLDRHRNNIFSPIRDDVDLHFDRRIAQKTTRGLNHFYLGLLAVDTDNGFIIVHAENDGTAFRVGKGNEGPGNLSDLKTTRGLNHFYLGLLAVDTDNGFIIVHAENDGTAFRVGKGNEGPGNL